MQSVSKEGISTHDHPTQIEARKPHWSLLRFIIGAYSCLAPLMNGGVANAQLAGNLCDRLPSGLCQPHRFLFKLSCIDFLNLCHSDPFPDLIEYISALGTPPIRGRVTSTCFPSVGLAQRKGARARPFSAHQSTCVCRRRELDCPQRTSRRLLRIGQAPEP